MSVDFGAVRPGGINTLRAGAALALVLTAAAYAPSHAQTGPVADADSVSPVDEPTPNSPSTEDDDGKREQDRVYVLGRRVQSSVATVNTEDAPQVINIIDGETLQEQGVSSLEQALRNVPGITTQIGEGGVMSGDQFFIRGLSAKNDIFTDGLRDFGVFTRDSFNYGQVEVFKGPSASAFGRGAAGGGINTTSKAPFLDTAGNLSASLGDGEYQRITGDWNQQLGDGVAVRIAAMLHHNENTGRDHVYSDRWGVAPSIGFGLDGDTSITLAYLHQYEEKVPDYGIPTVQPTTNDYAVPSPAFGVDPTNYYGFTTDIDETVVDTITTRLRHTINDWVTLTSDLKYGYYQRYSQYTPVTCNAACATALLDGNEATVPTGSVGGPGPYNQDTYGIQNITAVSVTAPLFGLRNEFLAGIDASWQENSRNSYGAYASRDTTKDLLNPQFGATPVRGSLSNVRDATARDVSLFVNDRMWFTDEWSLNVGLRQAWYEIDQTITNVAAATCNGVAVGAGFACNTGSNTAFFTPQVSVMFEPDATQTYYLSYSTSAKPPGVSVANADTIAGPTTPAGIGTQDLDPEENTNVELGGRLSLFDSKLQLQGAVFQTKKDNAKESDPLGNITRSGDSQEVKGVELGLAGAITDEWSVNASYTFLDTETTDSATTYTFRGVTRSVIGNEIAFTPKHAASLWTTYTFTGDLLGLEIGGGVTYQDDVWLNVQNTAYAPGYTTLDGMVSYAWDRFRVSLNGYNLSDETYYAQVHGNRVTPGQGRTVIATLGVVF